MIDMHLANAITIFGVLVVYISIGLRVALCGNEVFSSLADLETIWYKNIAFLNIIENIINDLPEPPPALKE